MLFHQLIEEYKLHSLVIIEEHVLIFCNVIMTRLDKSSIKSVREDEDRHMHTDKMKVTLFIDTRMAQPFE
jgi:hypothetical protein